MSVFTPSQRRFAEAVSQLTFCNPFLPERIAWERAALGDEFDERYAHWNLDPEGQLSPNIERLTNRGETILTAVRDRVSAVRPLEESELQLYEDVLLFVLFHRFRDQIPGVATGRPAAEANRRIGKVYRETQREAEAYLTMDGRLRAISVTWPHAFAAFFQLCRAFDNISRFIIGVSPPAVALRAAVWQSIFTHDMRRYGRVLFDRMADYTTLVMGPSGTGKELVARAVGLSRYVPFDAERQTFRADFAESFFPISLSAMSPTLIESELFGHQRGAFTGAVSDRAGWLEVCPPHGTVFLDEIGELDPAIQVKLLRVLQERTFSRLGETDTRRFDGKIVAATNRDLDDEMHAGRFRQDLYYRLCSDIIHVPSLKERIAADPGELHQLTLHLSQRLVGEEGPALAAEVEAWDRAAAGGGLRLARQRARVGTMPAQRPDPQRVPPAAAAPAVAERSAGRGQHGHPRGTLDRRRVTSTKWNCRRVLFGMGCHGLTSESPQRMKGSTNERISEWIPVRHSLTPSFVGIRSLETEKCQSER
jgi:hypothetical protein